MDRLLLLTVITSAKARVGYLVTEDFVKPHNVWMTLTQGQQLHLSWTVGPSPTDDLDRILKVVLLTAAASASSQKHTELSLVVLGLTSRSTRHFGADLPIRYLNWCKILSLLNQSLDWYWQN